MADARRLADGRNVGHIEEAKLWSGTTRLSRRATQNQHNSPCRIIPRIGVSTQVISRRRLAAMGTVAEYFVEVPALPIDESLTGVRAGSYSGQCAKCLQHMCYPALCPS